MKVAVIDNYDSFVYNLVQYLGELGADPVVFRNDAISTSDLLDENAKALLVSPGPGLPESAGISNEAIRAFGTAGIPVLGVCLGLQCIGHVYGGQVARAPEILHGKTSWIEHDGRGVFQDLPSPFQATRYHSLIVEAGSIPEVLEVTAHSAGGLVMGLRHRELPVEGVQFHPESILTGENGKRLLANFLALAAATPHR